MGKILKGKQVERVEALHGSDLEVMLNQFNDGGVSWEHVSKKFGVHIQTLYRWCRKLDFDLRRKHGKASRKKTSS